MRGFRLFFAISALAALCSPAAAYGAGDSSLTRFLTAASGAANAVTSSSCSAQRVTMKAATCRLRSAASISRSVNRFDAGRYSKRRAPAKVKSTTAGLPDGPLADLSAKCRAGVRDACAAFKLLGGT